MSENEIEYIVFKNQVFISLDDLLLYLHNELEQSVSSGNNALEAGIYLDMINKIKILKRLED